MDEGHHKLVFKKVPFYFKQEAHGPHRSPEKTVQINKHIQLYHKRRKKNIINFIAIL